MADIPKYQKYYSVHSPVLLDYGRRKPKVEKMLSILRDAGAFDSGRRKLALDIGCSGGFFIESLALHFEQVLGLDIDSIALAEAMNNRSSERVNYIAADSMFLPFADNSVDLIICNHVYEHVPDAVRLFSEIFRVLDDNGMCYFGAASRLTLLEPHYHLPFLSWLPKFLAHYYMRVMKKGDYYYENLRTYWGIKKLIRKFRLHDYTLNVVENPDRYAARDIIPKNSLIERIPVVLWKAFYWFLPGYIFILKKQGN
jgi:SAM-dependent methyltransferase